MAYEQRSYAGGAVETTITSDINATDLSISIAASTGWPSGGANGPFFVVIDRGLAGEEKVEIQSRTGTTLTVASTGKRGADDTSASSHATGASIAHCFTAQNAAEANSHIGNTALDHHSQYLNAARHGAVSHTKAMLAANSVGTSQIETNAVGADELADDAVDTGAIVDEAVTAAKIAADAVDTGHIVDEAVTAAKIAADAVDTSQLVDDAVTAAKLADGSVDTAAKIADTILTLAKFSLEAPVDYSGSITWTNPSGNFTLGTGGVQSANYYKLGKLVVMLASFTLGTSGNILGGTTPGQISLPFAAGPRGFVAARARSGAGVPWSGTGVIAAG